MQLNKLQSLNSQTFATTNHSLFGKKLKQFCDINLFRLQSNYSFGWSDGGCQILACSFEKWASQLKLNGSLHHLVLVDEEGPIVDHVVYKIQDTSVHEADIYLDGDGAAFKKELLTKWQKTERSDYKYSQLQLIEAATYRPFYIPFDTELSARLACELLFMFPTKQSVVESMVIDADSLVSCKDALTYDLKSRKLQKTKENSVLLNLKGKLNV